MNKTRVYLDYSAATPMDDAVLKQILPYFSETFYNPSATYLDAKQVAKDILNARREVAGCLGAKPSEIIFTAGGTEANNLAINGIMGLYLNCQVIVSAIEHESVLEPTKKYNNLKAPVDSNGFIDLLKLEKLITPKTVLISVMYANNEIGSIQPLRLVSKLISRVKKDRLKAGNKLPLYLHTDACQAPVYLDLHVDNLGVDLMTINGGKIYGPKQSGFLYINRNVCLQPQITGGGQEQGLRSGTENVANIIGLSKALVKVQKGYKSEAARLKQLQGLFEQRLVLAFPNVLINGSMQKRLPNNLNITFPGNDSETLIMSLDEHGIMCAAGSACSAKADNASHVLLAIGLDEAAARSSLRFSMGNQTTEKDIDYVIETLKKIL